MPADQTVPLARALIAARKWADEHGHAQPDDRMLSIIWRAGVAAGRAQAAADLRDIGRRFEAEAGQHLADGDRAGADATKQTAMGYWWAANAIVPPHEVARLNTEARITEESS